MFGSETGIVKNLTKSPMLWDSWSSSPDITLAKDLTAKDVGVPSCSLEVATIISFSGFAKSMSSIKVKICPEFVENLLPLAKTGKYVVSGPLPLDWTGASMYKDTTPKELDLKGILYPTCSPILITLSYSTAVFKKDSFVW